MMNKNIYLSILFTALLIWSCDESLDPEVYSGDNFVAFSQSADANVLESDGLLSFPIEIAQGATNDTQVNISTSGTAIEGVDYSFPNGSSVTIPAGEYLSDLEVLIIDDNDFGEAVTLVLEITGNSAGASIGLAETSSYIKTITIGNDDCNDKLTGTFDSSNLWGRGDSAGGTTDDPLLGPFASSATFSLMGCSGSEVTYMISDITGGLYLLGYGAADNPAVLIHNLDTNSITVDTANSPDVVYGNDEFSGSGVFNEDELMIELTWTNTFGDQGVSTFDLS